MSSQCNCCNVDLVLGENIPPSRMKNGWYICKSCVNGYNKPYNDKIKGTTKYKDRIKKYREKHKVSHIKSIKNLQNSIEAGIYGIFSDCKLIYIGESVQPYTRKVNHFSNCATSQCSAIAPRIASGELQRDKLRFKMFKYIDDTEARQLEEKRLIQRYKPLYNDIYV